MLLHPDDYDRTSVAWLHSLATGQDFNSEFRFRRKNGVYTWARTSARATRDGAGQITGWYGIALDIDVYKKTVSALLDRECELSQLVDMVPGHLWRLASDGAPTYFNERMREFFGFEDLEIEGAGDGMLESIFQAAHPSDEQQFRNGLARSLSNGDTFSLQHRLRRKDGVYRWLSSRAEPLRDQNGVIVNWYGLCFDIDDQMQAEQTLRRSEHELRDLVDTLPVDIMSFDPAGKLITYVSKHHIEQVGPLRAYIKDFDEMAADLTYPDDFPMMYRRSIAGLVAGQPFSHRFRRRNKSGTYRWIEARAQPLRDEQGEIVRWYIISIDIEDEVQAREELRVAQLNLARQSQAASLSELSASIAHEVNQPLAAVVANSHACQRWLAASPPNFERARTTIERIIRDANSAANVVSRIRALFKRVPDAHKFWAISEVITKARELLAEEAQKHGVRMVIDLAMGLPLVALDFVQIQQVLVNLIRNGIEAMDSIDLDLRTLTVRAFHRDGVVQIEVRDNGPGVDDPDRIFEPFHSSKRNGMGMGLAICRSIIEAHGGRLRTEPNGHHGAAFIFTLPSRQIQGLRCRKPVA
jgi:PAS domain S-box-containing protein